MDVINHQVAVLAAVAALLLVGLLALIGVLVARGRRIEALEKDLRVQMDANYLMSEKLVGLRLENRQLTERTSSTADEPRRKPQTIQRRVRSPA